MLTGSPGTNLQLSGAHASNGILGEGPRQLADGAGGDGGVWGMEEQGKMEEQVEWRNA